MVLIKYSFYGLYKYSIFLRKIKYRKAKIGLKALFFLNYGNYFFVDFYILTPLKCLDYFFDIQEMFEMIDYQNINRGTYMVIKEALDY